MITPLRTALLRELGISALWRLRSSPMPGEVAVQADSQAPEGFPSGTGQMVAPPVIADRKGSSAPSTPETTRNMGEAEAQPIPLRQFMPVEKRDQSAQVPQPMTAVSSRDHIAALDWGAMEEDIRGCTACPLHTNRKQAVPGTGDKTASWLFVGEAPGAEEDRKGEPFVGPAGQLLDKMLASIGLNRNADVYIANAVKCRPPSNRTPLPAEITECGHYLARQIALVKPTLIVALGRPAALALLGRDVKINEARGRIFKRDGIPVIITYHPSYLLRNPADKAKSWEDLCLALNYMHSN